VVLNVSVLAVCVYVGLDPDDFEVKSDKSKNPNSIQSGKWQLGFQGEKSTALTQYHKTLRSSF